MNEEIESDNKQREFLAMTINLQLYNSVCQECTAPARIEMVTEDYPIGVDYFEFCVNPQCINFDGSNLRRKREELERRFRQSKTFRRYHNRLAKAHRFNTKSLREKDKQMARNSYL